jgi:hypothetical protein
VAVEIAHALAKRGGVELVIVEYPSAPSVLDGLKSGAWDGGFLAIDPSRATLVDGAPYLQIDATYLVQSSSRFRTSVMPISRAFTRYNIVSGEDQLEALRKVAAYVDRRTKLGQETEAGR